MTGHPVPQTGVWNNRSYTLTVTDWARMVGKERGFIDYRLKRQSLQEILDELSSPSDLAISKFLYRV